jgi:hypothetical protein
MTAADGKVLLRRERYALTRSARHYRVATGLGIGWFAWKRLSGS